MTHALEPALAQYLNGPSLNLPEKLSPDEWEQIGLALGRAEDRYHWLVGDWWRHGEHHYGARTAIVTGADWEGPSFFICRDAGTVARAFQTSRRRDLLSFSHHREVAGLSPEVADQLLDWCEKPLAEGGKRRSVRELRAQRATLHHRDEKIDLMQYRVPLPAEASPAATAIHLNQIALVTGRPTERYRPLTLRERDESSITNEANEILLSKDRDQKLEQFLRHDLASTVDSLLRLMTQKFADVVVKLPPNTRWRWATQMRKLTRVTDVPLRDSNVS